MPKLVGCHPYNTQWAPFFSFDTIETYTFQREQLDASQFNCVQKVERLGPLMLNSLKTIKDKLIDVAWPLDRLKVWVRIA